VRSSHFLLVKNQPPQLYCKLRTAESKCPMLEKCKWKWKLINTVYSPNKLCQTQLTAFFCTPRALFSQFHIATKAAPLAFYFIPTARTLVILFLQCHSAPYVRTVTAYSVINAKRQFIHCLDQLKFSIKHAAHI